MIRGGNALRLLPVELSTNKSTTIEHIRSSIPASSLHPPCRGLGCVNVLMASPLSTLSISNRFPSSYDRSPVLALNGRPGGRVQCPQICCSYSRQSKDVTYNRQSTALPFRTLRTEHIDSRHHHGAAPIQTTTTQRPIPNEYHYPSIVNNPQSTTAFVVTRQRSMMSGYHHPVATPSVDIANAHPSTFMSPNFGYRTSKLSVTAAGGLTKVLKRSSSTPTTPLITSQTLFPPHLYTNRPHPFQREVRREPPPTSELLLSSSSQSGHKSVVLRESEFVSANQDTKETPVGISLHSSPLQPSIPSQIIAHEVIEGERSRNYPNAHDTTLRWCQLASSDESDNGEHTAKPNMEAAGEVSFRCGSGLIRPSAANEWKFYPGPSSMPLDIYRAVKTSPRSTTVELSTANVRPYGSKSCHLVSRGLTNRKGENNCFLNAVLQSLWNLVSFRQSFLFAPEHIHPEKGKQNNSMEDPPRVHETSEAVTSELSEARRVRSSFETGGNPGSHTEVTPPESVKMVSSTHQNQNCDQTTAIPCSTVCTFPVPDNAPQRQPLIESENLEDCLACALKTLFSHYAFSSSRVLPPDIVRIALSKSFEASRRFRLGSMEDVDETFDEILWVLHQIHVSKSQGPEHISRTDSKLRDQICTPPCISHQVFGLDLAHLTKCAECLTAAEPITSSSFIYRVIATEMLGYLSTFKNSEHSQSPTDNPVTINAGSDNDVRGFVGCHGTAGPKLDSWIAAVSKSGTYTDGSHPPYVHHNPLVNQVPEKCSSCGSKQLGSYSLCLKSPAVFIVSLVWPSAKPPSSAIRDVLTTIPPYLRLRKVFAGMKSADDDVQSPPHVFRGFVCYCCQHYIAIFFSTITMTWTIFDDAAVMELPTWSAVLRACEGNGSFPCLLFFEETTEVDARRVAAQLKPPDGIPHYALSSSTNHCAQTH